MFSLKPGKDGNLDDCCKPKPKKKQIILKTCPRDPYIRDASCRPNTSVRGMLIKKTYKDKCGCSEAFIIETFDGECVVPINFDDFCLNLTGDDKELVNILFEDASDHYCSKFGRPIRLLKANRLWKGEVRTAIGLVRLSPKPDADNLQYHQILDIRELENSSVTFIPIHTMGVSNDFAFMSNLEGKEVSIVYVDYDKESPKRCGIPIVIIELETN